MKCQFCNSENIELKEVVKGSNYSQWIYDCNNCGNAFTEIGRSDEQMIMTDGICKRCKHDRKSATEGSDYLCDDCFDFMNGHRSGDPAIRNPVLEAVQEALWRNDDDDFSDDDVDRNEHDIYWRDKPQETDDNY